MRESFLALQEPFAMEYEHVLASVTAAHKLFTVPDGKRLRIEKVEYLSHGGHTEHATNYWTIALQKTATVMASYSTQTAGDGTIADDTFVDLTLSATDDNRVVGGGEVVSVKLTESGTAVDLPAGRFVLSGHYV